MNGHIELQLTVKVINGVMIMVFTWGEEMESE